MYASNFATFHIPSNSNSGRSHGINKYNFVVKQAAITNKCLFYVADKIIIAASFFVPDIGRDYNCKPIFFQTFNSFRERFI